MSDPDPNEKKFQRKKRVKPEVVKTAHQLENAWLAHKGQARRRDDPSFYRPDPSKHNDLTSPSLLPPDPPLIFRSTILGSGAPSPSSDPTTIPEIRHEEAPPDTKQEASVVVPTLERDDFGLDPIASTPSASPGPSTPVRGNRFSLKDIFRSKSPAPSITSRISRVSIDSQFSDSQRSQRAQSLLAIAAEGGRSTLANMNVVLQVLYRPGHRGTEEEHVVALINCLFDRSHLGHTLDTSYANSYSLAAFHQIFELKLNADLVWCPRIYMTHTRLNYANANGDIKRVHDQTDFEVALNELYDMRDGPFLRFMVSCENPFERADRTARMQREAEEPAMEPESALDTILSYYDQEPAEEGRGSLPAPTDVAGNAGAWHDTTETATLTQGEIEETADPGGYRRGIKARELEKKRLEAERKRKELEEEQREPPLQQAKKEEPPEDGQRGRSEERTEEGGAGSPGSPREFRKPPVELSPDGERPKSSGSSTTPQRRRASFVKVVSDAAKKAAEDVGLKKKKRTKREELRDLWEEDVSSEADKRKFLRSGKVSEEVELAINAGLDGEEETATELQEDIESVEEFVDDVSPKDHLTMRLKTLLSSPVLTQDGCTSMANGEGHSTTKIDAWTDCCRMFCRDPADTSPDTTVAIAGLNTEIYQYQAFGVYWQMVNARRAGGGFLADDPGLGKTLSFFAYIVVERQLSILWRDVEDSRAKNDGRHLQTSQQQNNALCPSKPKPNWIACPCSTASPTALMPYQQGIRLALVPSALVGTWWKQWDEHVDVKDDILGMRIVVDSVGLTKAPGLSTEQMQRSSHHPTNRNRMRATVTAGKDKKEDDKPKPYHEGYLLLSTKEAFPELLKTFKTEGGWVRHDKIPGEWVRGTRISLIIGIAAIDESHEEGARKDKGRAAILTEQLSRNTRPDFVPHCWGYSGTPFEVSPRALEGVLYAMEKYAKKDEKDRTGWQSSNSLRRFHLTNLDRLCKQFDEQSKSNTRDDDAIDRILDGIRTYLENFMIRRTADTLWFGHPLVKLKPHIHEDITFKRQSSTTENNIRELERNFQKDKDEKLKLLQDKWDNFPDARTSNIRPTKLAFNTMCGLSWRSRLLCDFPFLYQLAITPDTTWRLTLTTEELSGFRGDLKKEEQCPYGKYIKSIVESSPKCLWLYDFICELDAKYQDIDGAEPKLIIMSQFPQAAFILKLFIHRFFPDKKGRVGLVAGRMKQSEKHAIIDGFTDAVSGKDKDGNEKRKTRNNYQILVGTVQALGVGLQLTRAQDIVLMEPDTNFNRQIQAYARVHRIGQRNPGTLSFRLIDSGSEIEQAIVKKERDRREFPGKLLSPTDPDWPKEDEYRTLKKKT